MGRVETIKAKHEKQIAKLFKSHLHGRAKSREKRKGTVRIFFLMITMADSRH